MIIETKRLILRPWKEEDFEPFAKLNADPRVMEHFPATLSQEESFQAAKRMKATIEEQGWGWWVATLNGTGEFIGFIGLDHVHFPAHFTPAVETGWRLGFNYWGKGYATEGAKACLQYGFETLKLPEIVAFTATQNLKSRAVMERIGMTYNPADDFDRPKVPEGSKVKRHVLYRKTP